MLHTEGPTEYMTKAKSSSQRRTKELTEDCRKYLHLRQFHIRYIWAQYAGHVAPQTARRIGALVHTPGGMVSIVLVGGTALTAHTFELPRLLATLPDTLLPVGSVRWVQNNQFRDRRLLFLRLWFLHRRRRGFQFFNAIDGIPWIMKSYRRKLKPAK